MLLASKLQLENRVFARAAQLHAPVHSKYGGLFCQTDDLLLQSLLRVYNAFFRAENLARFEDVSAALTARQNYLAQRACSPGLVPVYHAGELSFELILEEDK